MSLAPLIFPKISLSFTDLVVICSLTAIPKNFENLADDPTNLLANVVLQGVWDRK